MILHHLSLTGFGCFARPVALDFPRRGVVLVTGPNGAGKSTLVDAVAVGLWGVPMRRRTDGRAWSPWQAKRVGEVCVKAEGLEVVRTRSKTGKTELTFTTPQPQPRWESATHAQRALDRIVGPFDVWRRARVFSGADAAHLSLASDADRKALIEVMLGLGAFDAAGDIERRRAKARRDALSSAEGEEERARRAHAAADATLRAAVEAREGVGAVDAALLPFPSLAELDAHVATLRREHADAVRALRFDATLWREEEGACLVDMGRVDEGLRELARRERVLASDACSACGTTISTDRRAEHAQHAAERRAHLASFREVLSAVHADAVALRKAADVELERLRAAHTSDVDRLASVRAELLRREALADVRRKAEVRVAAAQKAADEARAVLDACVGGREKAEVLLAIAETALAALHGTRSAVLSRCLGGIERAANAWLVRLGASYRVRLSPTTESKSGSVRDAISIGVDGAGGGQDYGGCSSGERRRIDVALLMGLGDVNDAANEGGGGTLFFDEVDGHLDAEGREVFASALREVGRGRACVVVTHNEDFAHRLRPAVRWVVGGGGVVVG